MTGASGKDLTKVLERHGWTPKRIHGSHHIYVKEGSPVRLSVPIHTGRPLKRGLLLHLPKQAGLAEKDLS